MPTILVVAGPNGAGPNSAGKTTFATRWINDSGPNHVFANAMRDREAVDRTGAVFDGTRHARGPHLLANLDEAVAQGADIVLETTLSSRLYARRIPAWRAAGYAVDLVYVSPASVDVSIGRVAHRVRMGGHDVPEADLRRRFGRSLANLEIYKRLVNRWKSGKVVTERRA